MQEEDEEARREMEEAAQLESLGVDNLYDVQEKLGDGFVRARFMDDHRNFAEKTFRGRHPDDTPIPWPFPRDEDYQGQASSSACEQRQSATAAALDMKPCAKARPLERKRSYSGERKIGAPSPSKKEGKYDLSDCSQELLDLIYMCNKCVKNDRGDFIWPGWGSYHWGPQKMTVGGSLLLLREHISILSPPEVAGVS